MGASCSCSTAVAEEGGEGQKEVTLCFIGLDNAGKSTVVNNYRGAPSKVCCLLSALSFCLMSD
jgi:GTP-binding protein EngB required for normal cell division